MGLFNKLKNALFEEEEIEVRPPAEEKVVIKEDSVEPKREIPVKEELPKENERDLFKAENTFKFPDFDEEEFVTSYNTKEVEEKEEPIIAKPKEPETRRVGFDSLSPLGYDGERKSKILRKEQPKREKPAVQKQTETKNGFRPSPVISPVYGVLDKNYKKEDIISVEDEKKKFNVDMARKKAFGTLEEDIEKTMNDAPVKKFYDSRSRDIDDLLSHSADDAIAISDQEEPPLNRMSRNKNVRGRKYAEEPEEDYNDFNQFSNSVEQELTQSDENLEVLDKEPKSPDIEEDTLESDLFDLIDSMYDNREEE